MRESVLDISGRRYQFLRVGRGRRKLVLIHGLAASKEAMLDYAKPLTKGFSCLFVDLPGHNGLGMYGVNDLDSYANYVKGLIQKLGWKRFGIVGFSFGGFVALRLSEMYRKEGKRLPAVAWACPLGRKIATLPIRYSLFLRIVSILPKGVHSWIMSSGMIRWLVAAGGIRLYEIEWRAIVGYDTTSVGLTGGIIREGLEVGGGVEKLIVLGHDDILVKPNRGYLESKPRIKDTRIVVIEGGGHYGTKKGIAEAIREIEKFLRRYLR